jgi:hypothetical protein
MDEQGRRSYVVNEESYIDIAKVEFKGGGVTQESNYSTLFF